MKAGLQLGRSHHHRQPDLRARDPEPEQGCGLDGLLRARSAVLSGILNGVDYAGVEPRRATRVLAHPYDWRLAGKQERAKAALQRKMGLQVRPDALLFGVVSRLTEQKGLHLVLKAWPMSCVTRAASSRCSGSGDAPLEQAFLRAAARHAGPDRASTSATTNRSPTPSSAGGDVILVPSRFEPCGLTQTVRPALRQPCRWCTGSAGWPTRVVDASAQNLAAGRATGFVFDEFSAQGLRSAPAARLRAACAARRHGRRSSATAMQQRFDWHEAAASIRGAVSFAQAPTRASSIT